MITIEDIKKDFDAAISFKTRPNPENFKKYLPGSVIDEEKSVRWNREQVEARNNMYREEELRLREVSRSLEREADTTAVAYIVQETGLSHDKAVIIWNRVWDDHHSFMDELYPALEDMLEFINSILH